MNFLRSLAEKLGAKSKPQNKYPVKKLKDSGKILIDESCLYCPICYEVYAAAPLVLYCGHTFCESCVSRLGREGVLQAQSRLGHRMLHCPMCREPSPLERLPRNFLIEDLISGVQAAIDDPMEDDQKTTLVNAKVVNKRLEARCRDLTKEVDSLKNELDSIKQRESRNYLSFFIFVGAYLLYRMIFNAR